MVYPESRVYGLSGSTKVRRTINTGSKSNIAQLYRILPNENLLLNLAFLRVSTGSTFKQVTRLGGFARAQARAIAFGLVTPGTARSADPAFS